METDGNTVALDGEPGSGHNGWVDFRDNLPTAAPVPASVQLSPEEVEAIVDFLDEPEQSGEQGPDPKAPAAD